ncbi:gluconokinase [Acidisoma silvae]|nr:gluconokinase [Acidisoma silvae]
MPDTSPASPRFTALIFMGVSGSGKSTVAGDVARRAGLPMIEGDEMHPAGNIAKMSQGIPLTDADREPWLEAIAARIDVWRQAGQQGVITCSSLKRAYRDILRSGHTDVHFVYLKGSYELLLDRMQHRKGHFMPASLLRSQFDTLEEPGPDEATAVSIDQPEAAIVEDALKQLNLG